MGTQSETKQTKVATPPAPTTAGRESEASALLPSRRNQSLTRLFRSARAAAPPGLPVVPPTDVTEIEADRAADAVMRMGSPATPVALGSAAAPGLRAKCTQCEDEVRRDATGDGPSVAPPAVNAVLSSPGRPLDAAARGFFEPRFGADFSGVRIHDDAPAAALADAVRARAYAVGSDVVFAAGEYAPHTDSGQRLLAHELAHVVQQGNGVAALRREEGDDKRVAAPAQPESTHASITPQYAHSLSDPALHSQVEAIRQRLPQADVTEADGLKENLSVLETEVMDRSLRTLQTPAEGFDPASHSFIRYAEARGNLDDLGRAPSEPDGILLPGDQMVVLDDDGQVQLLAGGDFVQIDEKLFPILDGLVGAAAGGPVPALGSDKQLLLWDDGRSVLTQPATADLATLLVRGQPSESGPAELIGSLDAPWRTVRDAGAHSLLTQGLYQLGSHPISQFNGVSLPPNSRVRFADSARALKGQMDSRLITIFERGTKRYYAWDAHLPVPSAKVSHPYYHVNQKGMYNLFGHSDHAPIPASALRQARGLRYLRVGGRIFIVVGLVVDGALLIGAAADSAKQGNAKPLAAQAIRTIGGWGGGWVGAKVGCAVGAAAGVETGPGLVLTCIGGGLIGGFAGYFGADWVADLISPD